MKPDLVLLLLTLFVSSPSPGIEPMVQFIDVTASTGIDFQYSNGATGDYHLPETLGSGGAFFDYNNDGHLDLYLINSGDLTHSDMVCRLYHNNGDGTFTDVTTESKMDSRGHYGQGVATGDYDNDGDVDLYRTNFRANHLYRNNGDGTFTEVGQQTNVADPSWSTSATFFDHDRDGYLDLYVVNYVDYSLTEAYPICYDGKIRSYCHPRFFQGVPDRLYRNNGDGTFDDITERAGIEDPGGSHHGKGLGVVAADFNNDRYPDIYVANDDTPNYLFLNNGDGTFLEIGTFTGAAYSGDGVAEAGMGVDAGDYNGDGFLDVFVTNFSYETNTLYHNNGDGTFSDVSYRAHLGEESYLRLGFGTNFLDYDNDGDLDLFIANGHLSPSIEQSTDAVTYAQPDQLFQNNGNGTFTETSPSAGSYFQQKRVSRGSIMGDYDNDGDLDLVITTLNGAILFLRNQQEDQSTGRANWLSLKTVGTVSNRDGIGTRLIFKIGSQQLIREVRTSASYLSSHDPRVLVGASSYQSIDRIEIHWPSGIRQALKDVPTNQHLKVVENKIPE